MKLIATAAIVAICGLLQIAFSNGGLTDLRNDIARKQYDVWNITMHLLEEQAEITSPNSIDNEKEQFYQNVSLTIGAAVRDLESTVEDQIAAGKVAGPCGETAATCFETVNTTTFTKFELCEKNITTFALNYLNIMDTVLVEGQKIGLYLASIFPTCINTDLERFETCVTDLSQNTTAQVESYKVAAENVTNNAGIEEFVTVLSLLSDWGECIENSAVESVTGTEGCKTAALSCINALPVNN